MNDTNRHPAAGTGIPGITAPWPVRPGTAPRMEPHRPQPQITHEVARQYYRELPKPRGFRRRLKLALSHFFMAILIRLPVPSEVKWQYSLDLIRTLTVEYYQDVLKTMPEQHAKATVARALYASGRRWMLHLRKEHKDNSDDLANMGDLINRVFRALDIDSSVYVEGGEVVVINHRCPYLAHGVDQGIQGDKMCQMVCGMGTSLVEGLNDGLPAPLTYRSDKTMGRGGDVCVKRFAQPSRRSSFGVSPLHRTPVEEGPLPPGPVPDFIRDLKKPSFNPAHPQDTSLHRAPAAPKGEAKPMAIAKPHTDHTKPAAVHKKTQDAKPARAHEAAHVAKGHAGKRKPEDEGRGEGKG